MSHRKKIMPDWMVKSLILCGSWTLTLASGIRLTIALTSGVVETFGRRIIYYEIEPRAFVLNMLISSLGTLVLLTFSVAVLGFIPTIGRKYGSLYKAFFTKRRKSSIDHE